MYSSLKIGERLQVDLRKLKWISPVGNAALVASLHRLNKKLNLEILIPHNESSNNVISYMERMDFFKVCPPVVKEAFENSCNMDAYYERKRNNQTEALFELRKVQNDDEIGPLQNAAREIMRGKIPDNRISDIVRILGELANNSIEHGESPCFPCIQYYPKLKKVEIAIGDHGKGIVESLKNYVEHTSDHDVVEKAIFTNASGVSSEDRGRGLVDVQELTFKWSDKTEFFLVTNRSAYQVHNSHVSLLKTKECDFGTYYYIVINLT